MPALPYLHASWSQETELKRDNSFQPLVQTQVRFYAKLKTFLGSKDIEPKATASRRSEKDCSART